MRVIAWFLAGAFAALAVFLGLIAALSGGGR